MGRAKQPEEEVLHRQKGPHVDASRDSNIQPGLPGSPRPRGSPLAVCAPQGKESVGLGLAALFSQFLPLTHTKDIANLSLEVRETVQKDVQLLWDSKFPQDHKTQESDL